MTRTYCTTKTRRRHQLTPSAGRALWNLGRVFPRSFHLDACELYNLAPLFNFVRNEFAERAWRHWHLGAAQIGKARFDRRSGEPRVDLFIERIHDLRGRILGRTDPGP